MTRTHTTIDSPVGPLTLVADGGALCRVQMDRQAHASTDLGTEDPAALVEAARQLGEYFDGTRRHFDLPLAPVGTPWQLRVWAALRDIPYGTTESYGSLARRLGAPGASRAVGSANSRNPLGIVVPCHRVVGATGALTGYAGGTERKRALLGLEAAVALSAPAPT